MNAGQIRGRVFRLAVLAGLLIMTMWGWEVLAGPYPAGTVTSFAGMVKPQRGVIDYTGTSVPGYYSTLWTGNYLGGGEGTIQIPPGQTWIFYVTASDGVRLWVDSNLIVDQWHTQEPPTTYTTLAPIGPGSHQVKVEYYEDTGDAVIQLAWQKALDTFLPVVLHEATPTPTITPTPTRTITPTPCPYPPGDPRCTG